MISAIEIGRSLMTQMSKGSPSPAWAFVELVLHPVEGCEFDVGVDQMRRVGTDLEAMPGMGTPTVEGRRECHRSGSSLVAEVRRCLLR
jgi:hypothetical protein